MPGITSCPYTLARKSNVTRAQIDKAINWQKCIASGCDWAPIGKIKNPPVVKPAEAHYIPDWNMLGKVEAPKEPKYFSPFASTGA